MRAPVDDARRAIDPAALVEGDEGKLDRAHVAFVHREALAGPVERCAEHAVLADDRRADGAIPLIDQLREGIATNLLFGAAIFRQPLLDHVLGGDRGVVGAGKEQNLVTSHAAVARPDVLHGSVQRMPHVQLARDVRWGQADRVLGLVALGVCREETGLLPTRVPAGLDGLRVVGGLHVGDGFAHGRAWIQDPDCRVRRLKPA